MDLRDCVHVDSYEERNLVMTRAIHSGTHPCRKAINGNSRAGLSAACPGSLRTTFHLVETFVNAPFSIVFRGMGIGQMLVDAELFRGRAVRA